MFGPAGGVNSAHGVHAVKARAGHHLAPLALTSGRNTFVELGRDFTLLAFDASESDILDFEDAARQQGVPLKIMRPDQYVVWAGESSDGKAASIVKHVTGWN